MTTKRTQRHHAAAVLIPLVLTACGDGLVHGEDLEELLGLAPAPEDPAWELHWYTGPRQPLTADCTLVHASSFDSQDVVLAGAGTAPPLVDAPGVWLTGDDHRWAAALAVLVDRERYSPPDPDEHETGLDPARGVWGAASERVLLFGEGDLDALTSEIGTGSAPDVLDDGPTWVGLTPQVASATAALEGALFPLSEADWDDMAETGLQVVPTEALSEDSAALLSGDVLGGTRVLGDCS